MRHIKNLTVVFAMSMLVLASRSARADEYDESMTFTFSGPVEVPGVVLEELLKSTDRDARGQSDGFSRFAFEVGQQTAAVSPQMGEGLGVTAAEEELVQEVGQGRPQGLDLVFGHGDFLHMPPDVIIRLVGSVENCP